MDWYILISFLLNCYDVSGRSQYKVDWCNYCGLCSVGSTAHSVIPSSRACLCWNNHLLFHNIHNVVHTRAQAYIHTSTLWDTQTHTHIQSHGQYTQLRHIQIHICLLSHTHTHTHSLTHPYTNTPSKTALAPCVPHRCRVWVGKCGRGGTMVPVYRSRLQLYKRNLQSHYKYHCEL